MRSARSGPRPNTVYRIRRVTAAVHCRSIETLLLRASCGINAANCHCFGGTMKGTLAGFVALPLFVAALTAWGQDLPADTQDFKAKRHSNDADDLLATVASFRETLNDDGKIRLYYNVCNHASKALLFRWPKPGFETGITHPLASNSSERSR